MVRDMGDGIDLRYNKRADILLQYRWIVEQHLKDSKYILFNWQPLLHKMSKKTYLCENLRATHMLLNISVTLPYNTEFIFVKKVNKQGEYNIHHFTHRPTDSARNK
ncbi:hypothetical protein BY996DRAFT_6425590 [Phakopsora pachyrhizi]|nr:hypothetical protein BY996DRAFT_6425590 [Phakopsora pachyrhizi]